VRERRFHIEFWEDERGAKAVLDWIKNNLGDEQRAAPGKATPGSAARETAR